MHDSQILSFNSDNFTLKAAIFGVGPAAIVIGSHIYYPRTFSENLAQKLQLICIDTRGFTLDKPAQTESDFTLDKCLQDIEIVRQKLNLKKVILIGHSIHAFMALEYARQNPDRVSHLVLMASSPIAGPLIYQEADRYFEESVCPARKSALLKNSQGFTGSSDSLFVSRLLSAGPRLWYDYEFDASSLWQGVLVNSIGAGVIWGSLFAQYDTAQALQSVQCPIFLALGRYDYFNPPHLWEAYRAYCQELIVRVFEKSGHTPQLEEQAAFDQELINWLALHPFSDF